MGLFKTEGVVIRRTKTGESGLMLTLLTPDHGLVSASARGARNTKSKLGAGVGLFCYSEFLLYSSGREVYQLRSAVLKESFYSLSANIERLAYATYVCDLTGYVAQEETEPGEMLPLLLNTLYLFANSDKNLRLVRAVFELRLLCAAGFAPDVSGCVLCGKPLHKQDGPRPRPIAERETAERPAHHQDKTDKDARCYFSAREGGLLCSECRGEAGDARPVSWDCVSAVRHVVESERKRAFAFAMPEESLRELEEHVQAMLEQYIGKQFYSRTYLDQITGR